MLKTCDSIAGMSQEATMIAVLVFVVLGIVVLFLCVAFSSAIFDRFFEFFSRRISVFGQPLRVSKVLAPREGVDGVDKIYSGDMRDDVPHMNYGDEVTIPVASDVYECRKILGYDKSSQTLESFVSQVAFIQLFPQIAALKSPYDKSCIRANDIGFLASRRACVSTVVALYSLADGDEKNLSDMLFLVVDKVDENGENLYDCRELVADFLDVVEAKRVRRTSMSSSVFIIDRLSSSLCAKALEFKSFRRFYNDPFLFSQFVWALKIPVIFLALIVCDALARIVGVSTDRLYSDAVQEMSKKSPVCDASARTSFALAIATHIKDVELRNSASNSFIAKNHFWRISCELLGARLR